MSQTVQGKLKGNDLKVPDLLVKIFNYIFCLLMLYVEPVWNIFNERWWEVQLHRPLHATTYHLNHIFIMIQISSMNTYLKQDYTNVCQELLMIRMN